MKVKLSKSAHKFLKKLNSNSRQAVIAKIGILKTCLETQKVYPPEELDIKKLKGELKSFSRIRVGVSQNPFTARLLRSHFLGT